MGCSPHALARPNLIVLDLGLPSPKAGTVEFNRLPSSECGRTQNHGPDPVARPPTFACSLSSPLTVEWVLLTPVRDPGMGHKAHNGTGCQTWPLPSSLINRQGNLPGWLLLAALALVAELPARLIAAGSSAGYHFHSLVAAGGPGHDQANAVAVDAQGHVHLAGSFEGTARFGPTNIVSSGRSDAFLARYDAGGELLWVCAFRSTDSATATAVAVDPQGCSLVAGHFLRDLDLGGVWLTNRGSYDGFVAKVDRHGTLLWTVQVGGTLDDRVNAIAVDGTGHTAMAGHFMNTVEFGGAHLTASGNFPDIFIARIAPDGEVLWAAQGGGPLPDDAFGVAVDAVGNSVVVGTVAGTNTFGPLTLTNPAQAQIVVAACDPHGRFQWASSGGSDRPDSANAVALGSDGAALVTGAFGGPATLEGLSLTNEATRYTFTARYTADGTLDWLTAHPGQEARAVAVSPAGQFVVAGSFTGAQSFGSHLLTSAGAFDWFVLGHDSMGGIQWARTAGGPHMDYVHAIAPGLGADLWFAGRGTTNATFDHLVLTNAQGFDLLLARLSPAPLIREPPSPVVARAGAQISLRVVAVGTEPLTYQWYHGTTGLLPEARDSLLLLDPALPEHSGLYTVIVSNPFGSATHDPASVIIFGLAPPEVRINGETGETFEFTDVPSVLVSIDASEPDLVLYYTLDGGRFGNEQSGPMDRAGTQSGPRGLLFAPATRQLHPDDHHPRPRLGARRTARTLLPHRHRRRPHRFARSAGCKVPALDRRRDQSRQSACLVHNREPHDPRSFHRRRFPPTRGPGPFW
jgi:hypothetical protein